MFMFFVCFVLQFLCLWSFFVPLRCDHDSYRDCCCDCRHDFCQCSRNSSRDLLLEVFLSSSSVCAEEQGMGGNNFALFSSERPFCDCFLFIFVS